MGFDVTWHPISQVEMHQWYFDRLLEARQGDYAAAMKLAEQHQMGQGAGYQEVCKKGYRDLLEQGSRLGPEDPFDKTHSFILAMVQGMFRTYYYTRGGIYSALAEMVPQMAEYTLPFQEILGDRLQAQLHLGPIRNRVYENYCGGVYIPETQVPRLLADYEEGEIEGPLKQCFGSTLPVFLKALLHAKKMGLGLLEATEVVEPNPLDLAATTCRSYLMNCDPGGVMIYAETAKHQAEEAARTRKEEEAAASEFARRLRQAALSPEPPPPPAPGPAQAAPAPPNSPKKKGFFGRLFGGK